jgi:hypothetical protein
MVVEKRVLEGNATVYQAGSLGAPLSVAFIDFVRRLIIVRLYNLCTVYVPLLNGFDLSNLALLDHTINIYSSFQIVRQLIIKLTCSVTRICFVPTFPKCSIWLLHLLYVLLVLFSSLHAEAFHLLPPPPPKTKLTTSIFFFQLYHRSTLSGV